MARGVPGDPTKVDALWEHARRGTCREESHGRGQQNLPTTGQSAGLGSCGGEGEHTRLSPAIPVLLPARGWVKRTPWLLRWLLIEFIFAAGAQAVLPAVPAPELVVTAQTGRRSRIWAVFRGSAMGPFQGSLATHGGPQRCTVVGEGLPAMSSGQEPCHSLACSAADPPALSKPVIGAARSGAATPGP